MDRTFLVASGLKLLNVLDAKGLPIRAAVWVLDPDVEAWHLWLVPEDGSLDNLTFYRRVAQVLAGVPDLDLSTTDVRLRTSDDPAIAALLHRYRFDGETSIRFQTTMLGDRFVPDGLILRLPSLSRDEAA